MMWPVAQNTANSRGADGVGEAPPAGEETVGARAKSTRGHSFGVTESLVELCIILF
jgi:hypothetical protein